jgi:hypothetical protein
MTEEVQERAFNLYLRLTSRNSKSDKSERELQFTVLLQMLSVAINSKPRRHQPMK